MPVPIEHGCKAIEAVRKGDRVWMRPEHDPTAPPVLGHVVETFKTHAPIWELRIGGRAVRTTGTHTFWVRGKGWTATVDLKPGQELRTEDGWVRCEGAVDTGTSADVYNFEVAEGHTYFVGDPVTWGFALWNHNVDCYKVANSVRQGAVRKAWTAEANMIRQTGKGTVAWTAAQKAELLATGRVSGYVGHHINSVAESPLLAGVADNVAFVEQEIEHLAEHMGDFRNATFGRLLDRGG